VFLLVVAVFSFAERAGKPLDYPADAVSGCLFIWRRIL